MALQDDTRAGEVQGLVVDLDDAVATVEIGEDHDEWVFPRSMLPPDVDLDSVLVFDGVGTDAGDHRTPPAGAIGARSAQPGADPPELARDLSQT